MLLTFGVQVVLTPLYHSQRDIYHDYKEYKMHATIFFDYQLETNNILSVNYSWFFFFFFTSSYSQQPS